MQKEKRPPLKLALAQIRFSPVLKMKEYIPDIQDSLRKMDFPHYIEEKISTLKFGQEPSVEHTNRWLFKSKDEKEVVILTQDFIVIETAKYEDFQSFLERVKIVITTFHDQVEAPPYVTSIGLRYIDLIQELDGNAPEWFVRKEMLGITADEMEVKEVKHQTFSSFVTEEGTLNLRTYPGKGIKFMPPGLEDDKLQIETTLNEGSEWRVLDFDNIRQAKFDFNVDTIITNTKLQKKLTSQVFKAVVTSEALKTWGIE